MRSKGYSSWVCVSVCLSVCLPVCLSVCLCLSVCVSVKSHLTSGASVRPENTVMYPVGNEGQKICGVFSETTPLQRSSTAPLKAYVQSAIFLRKARMRIV